MTLSLGWFLDSPRSKYVFVSNNKQNVFNLYNVIKAVNAYGVSLGTLFFKLTWTHVEVAIH